MYNKGNNLASSSNNNESNGTTSKLNTNLSNSNSANITTDRIEWSRATILDFIEDYRRQRVLWDPNTKGYHIKQTKYEALKLLGLKYGAEIRSIRSKIKSLRSSFHREHGKVLNGKRKGLNYQPMWFAYDAIRFILDGESGDSDEAETPKTDSTNRETPQSEPKFSGNSDNNVRNAGIDEELLEERKISSRDIEHFNNHFLALGLQARHPMAVIAAVEAAAAASAAQERRQEQKFSLKQQEIDSATQLKLLELSTNATTTTASTAVAVAVSVAAAAAPPPAPANLNTTNSSSSSTSNSNNNNNATNLTSTSATFNPISKPFNNPKTSSPLATITSIPLTTATTLSNASIATSTVTATTSTTIPQQQLAPPSSASTCSLESLNAPHGSRSLDENSASVSAFVSATAIPSLSITAVGRNSDFDSSEYCNISADDVKTEIFESDATELSMLGSVRTSTPVPLNYHKNATDLTVNKNKVNLMMGHDTTNNSGPINGGFQRTVGSRKRKVQMHSNVNRNNEDAPTPSKLHQKQQHMQLQHSNATHSRQSNFLNGTINNYPIRPDDDNGNADNGGGEDDCEDDGPNYSNPYTHLQTTVLNSNSSSNNNNNNNYLTANNNNKTTNNSSSAVIDEYGVFGEYVAITIRKLQTSKAKIVVKHLINNLLYEAELGKYDQGISSCKEPPELYKM